MWTLLEQQHQAGDDQDDEPGAFCELADQLDDRGRRGQDGPGAVDSDFKSETAGSFGCPVPDHAQLGKGESYEDPDGEQRDQRLGVALGGDQQGGGQDGEDDDAVAVHLAVSPEGEHVRQEVVPGQDRGQDQRQRKSGGIWYKKAFVYAVDARIFGDTAILLEDMDLQAVVGAHEVTNPFMVTEVYKKENGKWKLAQLTFSHLLRPVKVNSDKN